MDVPEFIHTINAWQVGLPILSSGILLCGIVFFIVLYNSSQKTIHLIMTMIVLASFFYVSSEGIIIYFGGARFNIAVGMQFYRIQQIFAASFIIFLPLFTDTLLGLVGFSHKILKTMTIIGLFIVGLIVTIALLFPDLYISVTENHLFWVQNQGDFGRGRIGPFMLVRDLVLGVWFVTVLFIVVWEVFVFKQHRYNLSVLIALILTLICAADDITFTHTRGYIGIFSSVIFSRTTLGLTMFTLITMTSLTRRFIDQAREVEIALNAMEQSELRFRQVAHNIDAVFWLIDAESKRLLYMNPVYKKIWKRSFGNLFKSMDPWLNTVHPEDLEMVKQETIKTIPDKVKSIEYRIQIPEDRWIREKIAPVRNEHGEIIRIVKLSEDITARKVAEEDLVHMAYHDQLTNLFNRKSFFRGVNDALQLAKREDEDKPRALILCDLDHFTQINESLGHEVGDKLLKEIAGRMQEIIRKSDLVFRMGSDEFAFMLNTIAKPIDAVIVAEKIINGIAEAFNIGGHIVYLSASLGIAVFPKDGTNAEEILQNADSALQVAKRNRNTYQFFTEKMQSSALLRMQLINAMRHCVEKNELSLVFQPLIDCCGIVRGAEALVRWNNPELGIVSPVEFIPIAEDSGLIIQIGEWVIREACRSCTQWKQAGIDASVSINISAKQLWADNLKNVIESVLRENNLGPNDIHLEITETAIMENLDFVKVNLDQFNADGYKFSIDDFGTGYSSLSYLKHLPIHTVKIDRSFVIGLPGDMQDCALVRAIISMAKGLDLSIVAEGVDSAEQLDFLQQLDCTFIQGYYYSKPLPLEEFIAFSQKLQNQEVL